MGHQRAVVPGLADQPQGRDADRQQQEEAHPEQEHAGAREESMRDGHA
jgi:hypothetical protein